ncbi:glycosyltransferase [Leuconostoc miyukkimchii]|uniref:glycosyltransferase n=1 Tax=Leuconostoc miyukkimchii TaxID=910540 RepID=UPI001C7D6C6F|nr:glycosyltransferase [Leuconostoc miyukkimchii]
MNYLISQISYNNNAIVFSSDVDIKELYLNDKILNLSRINDKSYKLDFTDLTLDDFEFGRFQIFAKVGTELVRLRSFDFEKILEADRYFNVDGTSGAFVYLTINGYLNFAYLSGSSYLRVIERSYANFNYESHDIMIDNFSIDNNIATLSEIPKFNEVLVASQKNEKMYSVPFTRVDGITKIDFSVLLDSDIDRYFIFLRIADKNIRIRYSEILKHDVEQRYFELKKGYSVLTPNLESTQKFLYFSVNGRLAFLKSKQSKFKWYNYTDSVGVESFNFDLFSNNLSVHMVSDLSEGSYFLEMRDDQHVFTINPINKSSKEITFDLSNIVVNDKIKYLISLKFVNRNQEIFNSLVKVSHQKYKQLATKDYTIDVSLEKELLFLTFNDRQFFYTKKNMILSNAKFINEHQILISPESFVFQVIPQIVAQSRTSKKVTLLSAEQVGQNYLVDIDAINEHAQNEIFDIYVVIDNKKYTFKNLDALTIPVKKRYQEIEINDFRLSVYSTLGGTLALRKDEIDQENRQLYKYRTDDLVVNEIKSNDNYLAINLPDKVVSVTEVSILPRKGTNFLDILDFEFDNENNDLNIFNINTLVESQTKQLFNYFADYLLTWIDDKGTVHTSYLKALNFDSIAKPLRKFKPYRPEQENNISVQNYLNGAHNLSVQIKNLYYAENYDNLPIDNNIVLYETRDGKSFVDSPLYIFKYLLSHEQYKDLRHIVVLDDLDGQAAKYNKKKYGDKLILVERDTEQYAKYLLTAKYLINNSTFPSYFLKRDEQIYVNTWHGTPLKLMGMEMPYPANASQNVLRNLLMTDYVVAQNDRMYDMYTKSYRMNGIYSGRITKFGYPRMDSLINDKVYDSEELLEFGIKINKKLPTILYAPTHNGQNQSNPGDGVLHVVDDLVRLRSYFAQDYNVLIKVHPFVYDLVKDNEWLKGALIPDYLDTNYVLKFADILITDFSSIFVDFLGKNKRIIFFVPNFEQYVEERGVYDSVDNWPGEVINNLSELRESLKHNEEEYYVDKRQKSIDYYLKFDDGKATQKLVETVFDKIVYENVFIVKNNKKNILIYPGGMATNGITSVALNLTSKINHDEYNVFIIMNSANINEEDQFNNYLSLDEKIVPIFIFGRNIFDVETNIVDYEYQTFGIPKSESILATKLYGREVKRILPNVNINTAIDFSGYSYYFARYILGANADNRLIYMHNDLYSDARRSINGEFPHYHNLSVLFTAYKYFDKFVNVSKASEVVNRDKLQGFVDVSRMTTVDNPLAIESIIERSNEQIDWDGVKTIDGKKIEFINPNFTTYITAARLSPEKNQLNLVKAFAEFSKKNPENRLFILGDGPLRQDLQKIIKDTKSESNIFMMGRISNPMPYIKNSDVFVLPSLYEGQPMSMMEAMTLEVKYILSSNIPQSVELLENGKLGYITNGTTSEDILIGLRNVVNQEYTKFDPYAHNQKAMNLFYEKVK